MTLLGIVCGALPVGGLIGMYLTGRDGCGH
jgi:hypothetical protein